MSVSVGVQLSFCNVTVSPIAPVDELSSAALDDDDSVVVLVVSDVDVVVVSASLVDPVVELVSVVDEVVSATLVSPSSSELPHARASTKVTTSARCMCAFDRAGAPSSKAGGLSWTACESPALHGRWDRRGGRFAMRILFVDDEVRVLEGLERSLQLLVDDDWELEFVGSGAEALARVEAQEFDALVTDMRMRDIDGAELLARARERAPRTVRIVLSGQMEADKAIRAMELAHQILAKPCKVDLLLDVLRSSARFRSLLDDDGFRRAVISIDRLPAVPSTYREIETELARPSASAATVAAIVAKDPGLTARALQVANSPFFGGGRRIDDVRQAIARLGLQMMSALALAAVFEQAESTARELDLSALAHAARRTATIASRIAADDRAHAYLAGMLSEVGRVVFALTRPEQFDDAQRAAREPGRDLLVVEHEQWGVGHADVGAYLLALWGLPHAVVDAVAAHHRDVATLLDEGAAKVVVSTALARALADGVEVSDDLLQRCGVGRAAVEHALEEAA
jgi:HD-like signal output (HDOD) protein/CheY-like chemotaxis protein